MLGDILVAKGLVSRDDIQRAMEYQRENGGRLGDSLVTLEIVASEQIDEVLNEWPKPPLGLEDIDLDAGFLLQLMIKGMHMENLEAPSQISQAMALPNSIVNALLKDAVDRKLLSALGQADSGVGALAEMRYGLSREGRDWAVESIQMNQYFGPAPVSVEAFRERIERQKITNEWVNRELMDEAFANLVIPDRLVTRLGPAINSGTAILIYGPAGNGKTSIAEIVGQIFQNVIYVPHCFEVDGQIIKVFDPSIHKTVEDPGDGEGESPRGGLRRERIDKRWVPCYRPMVMTGGELTLDMLDLSYNESAKFYEAPLHIKALNGTFLIDDFGRQRVKPEEILNRWIVPLNSRVDYLNLHTGKAFELPFDELVIFSTNLHPNDLMDPAFQRRIPYKLETVEPPEDLFRKVFEAMAKKQGLELTDEVYQQAVDGIRANNAPLAYFQPKFIVEQVVVSCKFEGTSPQFTHDNVEDAMANLFVKEAESEMFGVAR